MLEDRHFFYILLMMLIVGLVCVMISPYLIEVFETDIILQKSIEISRDKII